MSDVALEILPPEPLRAVLPDLQVRLRGVAAYASSLNEISDGEIRINQDGIDARLPNPFKDLPETAAAVRRAKQRTSAYGAGNQAAFMWMISVSGFCTLFVNAADAIQKVYDSIPAAGPTPEQRTEVVRYFDALLRTLDEGKRWLVQAETGFLAALPLLREDQKALSAGAAGMNQAIAKFEETVRDAALKYALNPMTAGLAKIVTKIGNLHLDHLRHARDTVVHAADHCDRAANDVAVIAGHALVLIGKYQGVNKSLKDAQGAAFKEFIGELKLEVARKTWASFRDYILQQMNG